MQIHTREGEMIQFYYIMLVNIGIEVVLYS